MKHKFLTGLAAPLALLAACTGESLGPEPELPLEIVAGAGVSDTVESRPIQALVVRIGGAGSGVVVRFETRITPSAPWTSVSGLSESDFDELVVDTTDANGEAAARVQLGTVAGTSYVYMIVPTKGIIDSAEFTVLPGKVAGVQPVPADTAVLVGETFKVRGSAVDRFGNTRSDPFTLTALDPFASVAADSTIRGQQIGRAQVEVVSGPVRGVLMVSVVPDGVLSAITPTGIVQFRPDGKILNQTTPTSHRMGFTADWSPNGEQMAYDVAGGRGLSVLEGESTRQITGGTSLDVYPAFSQSGEWIYYARENPWSIRRIRPDGTGDESVVSLGHEAAAPSPSPDLSKLAYVVPGLDQLYVYDFAAQTSTLLSANGHSPAWSPVADQIAYVEPESGQLRMMAPTGLEDRGLTNGLTVHLGIDWSPDGTWILVHHTDGFAIVEAATGMTLPLAWGASWTAPAWRR